MLAVLSTEYGVSVIFFTMLLPVTCAALAVTGYAMAASQTTRRLPDCGYGAATEKAFVVVPVIVGSAQDVDASVLALRENASSTPTHLSLVLAVDFIDAATEKTAQDEVLIARLKAGLEDVRREHGARCGALVRKRTYNASAHVWMGWERKRGKLIEVFKWLRGHKVPSVSWLAECDIDECVFAIALDRDARLTRGAAERLISVASYGPHRALVTGNQILAGFTIIVPRIEKREPERKTSFYRLNEYVAQPSESGVRPDLHQDGRGQAAFYGKGLIDIDAFLALCDTGVPENSVLSHDHLEGMLGRCALVSDAVITEENPIGWAAWRRRQSRWCKGDFLLIRWIFLGRAYESSAARIDRLSRWLLLENLIRHLSVVGVAASTAVLMAKAQSSFVLPLLFLATPSPLGVVVAALVPGRTTPRGSLLRQIRSEATQWCAATLVASAYLFANAADTLVAVAAAVYGQFRKGRNLEWDAPSWRVPLWCRILVMAVVPCVVLLSLVGASAHPPVTLIAVATWTIAPIISLCVPRRVVQRTQRDPSKAGGVAG